MGESNSCPPPKASGEVSKKMETTFSKKVNDRMTRELTPIQKLFRK